MPGRKPVAIYGRVLTDWQTTENELAILKEIAAQRGWEVGEIYVDDAIKSATGRDRRPAFEKFLKDAARQHFESMMAWSLSQIGRSAQSITSFVVRLAALDIPQYYHKETIDTATSTGKAMVQMCVVLSGMERGSAGQRVVHSSNRARSGGGRVAATKVDPQTEWAICQALASGKKGIVKIAAEFSVSSGTVQRIKAEMNKLS